MGVKKKSSFVTMCMTAGAFIGTRGAYFMKAARARPVATAKRPPWPIKYSRASRFRSETRGGSPLPCRARSVSTRVLS